MGHLFALHLTRQNGSDVVTYLSNLSNRYFAELSAGCISPVDSFVFLVTPTMAAAAMVGMKVILNIKF